MIPNQPNQKERKPETKSKMKKAYLVMPLIIVLMLACVIPTIMLIIGIASERPTETAEVDKVAEQEEKISAAAVQSGKDITIEEAGVYLVELHGGKSLSNVIKDSYESEYSFNGTSGTKTIGYIYLDAGDVLSTKSHSGGGASGNGTAGGHGISAYLTKIDGSAKTQLIGYASGGPGLIIKRQYVDCSRTRNTKCDYGYENYTEGLDNDDMELLGWKPLGPNKNGTASGAKALAAKTTSVDTQVMCHPENMNYYTHTERISAWIGGGGGSLYAGSARMLWSFCLDW